MKTHTRTAHAKPLQHSGNPKVIKACRFHEAGSRVGPGKVTGAFRLAPSTHHPRPAGCPAQLSALCLIRVPQTHRGKMIPRSAGSESSSNASTTGAPGTSTAPGDPVPSSRPQKAHRGSRRSRRSPRGAGEKQPRYPGRQGQGRIAAAAPGLRRRGGCATYLGRQVPPPPPRPAAAGDAAAPRPPPLSSY